MGIEEIRVFVNDWAMLFIALLGLIAAWGKASQQIRLWYRQLNLYRRMRLVEVEVDELSSMAHAPDERSTS